LPAETEAVINKFSDSIKNIDKFFKLVSCISGCVSFYFRPPRYNKNGKAKRGTGDTQQQCSKLFSRSLSGLSRLHNVPHITPLSTKLVISSGHQKEFSKDLSKKVFTGWIKKLVTQWLNNDKGNANLV